MNKLENIPKRAASLAGGLLLTMALSAPAFAEDPKSLGSYKAWSAFSANVSGHQTCFVISDPEDSQPTNVTHGDVVFMVTNWKTRGVKNEPSFLTGYTFKEGSIVTAEVGSDKWELYTDKNRAWLREPSDEQSLIKAMKRGSSMRIKGSSARGTATEYRISLSGITAAINKIDAECS